MSELTLFARDKKDRRIIAGIQGDNITRMKEEDEKIVCKYLYQHYQGFNDIDNRIEYIGKTYGKFEGLIMTWCKFETSLTNDELVKICKEWLLESPENDI